ncbi:MAG TPA: regulatory protein RecX [Casimicrobiaceae bacterium]|nr:regulatory protein RecX [Casimicrobiaceae bacterium]
MQRRTSRSAQPLRQRAIAALGRREYARSELRSKLVATGGEPSEVDRLLDELERAGYLSDQRCASVLVRKKVAGYSKRAIAFALKEKGVASAVAQDALASIAALDEVATARALWERKFGEAPKDNRDKARQLRFLLSRGYSGAIAFEVMKRAGAATADDESDTDGSAKG